MTKKNKYDLGFSGCSLKTFEMVSLFEVSKGLKDQELGGKSSYIKRKNSELKKRLETLTLFQKESLIEGDSLHQRQIAFLSVCKTYDLVREFVVEVLREKMILSDFQLTEGEYLSFFRRKMNDHPELEELSELTEKKVKQVLFRILAEAGIIDSSKNKILQYQLLEPKMIRLLKEDDAEWFKVFMLSDFEISNYSN